MPISRRPLTPLAALRLLRILPVFRRRSAWPVTRLTRREINMTSDARHQTGKCSPLTGESSRVGPRLLEPSDSLGSIVSCFRSFRQSEPHHGIRQRGPGERPPQSGGSPLHRRAPARRRLQRSPMAYELLPAIFYGVLRGARIWSARTGARSDHPLVFRVRSSLSIPVSHRRGWQDGPTMEYREYSEEAQRGQRRRGPAELPRNF